MTRYTAHLKWLKNAKYFIFEITDTNALKIFRAAIPWMETVDDIRLCDNGEHIQSASGEPPKSHCEYAGTEVIEYYIDYGNRLFVIYHHSVDTSLIKCNYTNRSSQVYKVIVGNVIELITGNGVVLCLPRCSAKREELMYDND